MKILRGLRLASVLSSVSNLCLTEEEFKQHKTRKNYEKYKNNSFIETLLVYKRVGVSCFRSNSSK